MIAETTAPVAVETSSAQLQLRLTARNTLISVFGDLAAGEALTRALVSERTENRDMAMMWLDVYYLICRTRADEPTV